MSPDHSLSLYIHIPFCQTKCPYCDFNSYETSRDEVRIREKAYITALIKELSFQKEKYQLSGRKIRSIFFGGGTPSLVSGEGIYSLVDAARNKFDFSEEIEITIEANPRSIQEDFPEEKLKSFYDAGINRISFGAQSFIQDKLDFLGRWHTPDDTVKSIEMAKNIGFNNINLDLMFGVKGEEQSNWEYELSQAIEISPTHISTYMLTMEPGTVFGKRSKKGEVFIVEDDAFVSLYETSQRMLEEAGYEQYEISNFSKPNMACRHNIVYWKGGGYLGLGAGAHSFIKGVDEYGLRWSNTPSPSLYVTRVMNDGAAIQIRDPLTKEKVTLEKFSFGLRMCEGLSLRDPEVNVVLDTEGVRFLLSSGFLEISENMLRIPRNKLYLADSIVSEVCDFIY